jgi:hypothetical protein
MPETFRSRLQIPEDDFILVTTDSPDDCKIWDAVMDEINAIVYRYGGLLDECGPVSDRTPFEELFDQPPRRH